MFLQSDEEESVPAIQKGNPGQNQDVRAGSADSEEFQDFVAFNPEADVSAKQDTNNAKPAGGAVRPTSISQSSVESFAGEVENSNPVKSSTPSMGSSGYGSQALSSQTLSSEDSASVRSISTDDTPDNDHIKKGDLHGNIVCNQPPNLLKGINVGSDSHNPDLLSGLPEGEAMDSGEEDDPESEVVHGKVQRSESLIDTDVPSNLGSPLQPTPTTEFQSPTASTVIMNESTNSDDTSVLERDDSESVTTKTEEVTTAGDTDTVNGTSEEKEPKVVPAVDHYSETAMDELERFTDVSDVDSSHVTKVTQSENASDPSVESKTQTVEPSTQVTDDGIINETQTNKEPVSKKICDGQPNHTQKVKLRKKNSSGAKTSDDKTNRRRSWADKQDNTVAPSGEDSGLQSRVTEVRMKKSPSIDAMKSGNMKPRLRTDRPDNKGGPSPMKATYRPVSMPVDHLNIEDGAVEPKSGEDSGMCSEMPINRTVC